MNMKKGIAIYGDRAIEAGVKEYEQFTQMNVLTWVPEGELTRGKRIKALRAINIIKQKKDETIKWRACANVRSQRLYATKNESSSPTVSLESILLSLVIDGYKKQYYTVFYVPGAYLNANMPPHKK